MNPLLKQIKYNRTKHSWFIDCLDDLIEEQIGYGLCYQYKNHSSEIIFKIINDDVIFNFNSYYKILELEDTDSKKLVML